MAADQSGGDGRRKGGQKAERSSKVSSKVTQAAAPAAASARFSAVSTSVFQLPSLSQLPPHLQQPRSSDFVKLCPKLHLGHPVAIDTEFVSVAEEETVVSVLGARKVRLEAKQALARVSAVDALGKVIIDDYVLPSEPVVDYKTRFSGLVAEDLDPRCSPHHLVHLRTTYLKLRCLVDSGCLVIGHGLKTDFRVANIFVPPHQIGDTLELWSLPSQRKLSLRFLAGCLLGGLAIQGETHDSIEDARTALRLWECHQKLSKRRDEERSVGATGSGGGEEEEESVTQVTRRLYSYGQKHEWKYDANDPFLLPEMQNDAAGV